MKKRTIFLLALSVSFAAGLLVGKSTYAPKLVTMDTTQATDAAFRDGLYQAKLDIQEGRKPHPAIGRWSNESARAQFIAGYQRGYRDYYEATSAGVTGPSIAELAAAGYRDGMLDGSWHRSALQPFQADQTTNYRAAGMAYVESSADREEYKRYYREGYVNGYQQAYYARSIAENGKNIN
jgi:hypothetical protein